MIEIASSKKINRSLYEGHKINHGRTTNSQRRDVSSAKCWISIKQTCTSAPLWIGANVQNEREGPEAIALNKLGCFALTKLISTFQNRNSLNCFTTLHGSHLNRNLFYLDKPLWDKLQ